MKLLLLRFLSHNQDRYNECTRCRSLYSSNTVPSYLSLVNDKKQLWLLDTSLWLQCNVMYDSNEAGWMQQVWESQSHHPKQQQVQLLPERQNWEAHMVLQKTHQFRLQKVSNQRQLLLRQSKLKLLKQAISSQKVLGVFLEGKASKRSCPTSSWVNLSQVAALVCFKCYCISCAHGWGFLNFNLERVKANKFNPSSLNLIECIIWQELQLTMGICHGGIWAPSLQIFVRSLFYKSN